MDENGKQAHVRQENPNVFFLCQTFEKSIPPPLRFVSIPRGMSVFIPLINWISLMPEDGQSIDDLVKKAQQKMNVILDLRIQLDGEEIQDAFDYRVQSAPFDLYLPKNNILNLNEGQRSAISDGYWILTTPLEKPITLFTYGSCTSGLTRISASYNIGISEPSDK